MMTSASHARAGGMRPVHARGHGQAATHWTIAAMPDLARLTAADMASERAFAMAGIGRDATDVVEVYDSFTITTLLTLEALGFAERGGDGTLSSGATCILSID